MDDEAILEQPAAPRGDSIHQPRTLHVKDLVKLLLSARADYNEERIWHKFLLDAYAGTGGFQGRVRQPFASFWGWAADVYANDIPFGDAVSGGTAMESEIETYLDRFDREDVAKFKRRVNSSHYPNYVSTFVDVPLSFMFRKQFSVKPDAGDAGTLAEWAENADGAGNSWSDIVRDTLAPRAAVLGYTAALFDLPNSGTTLPTALDDQRAQRRPYVVPLFPSNLLEWNHDHTGTLRWAKVRHDYVRRDSPLEPGLDVTRITVWTVDGWEWFELAKGKGGRVSIVDQAQGKHPFGRVPIVFLRRKPVPDDPVRGIPMASSASEEARRLFNYLSELDEHLRSCAFAFLQVVTDNPGKVGSMVAGNGNALPLKPDWNKEHKWITPDPAVSQMYEKRCEVTVEEMYRTAKMEFTRGVRGGQARSGVSQSFEFESANRAIADVARNVARFDEECRRLVAGVLPGAPDAKRIQVTAPQRFDVEEMAKELDEATTAISMRLGPTATAEIKKKVARGQLPMVDPEVMARIETEIAEAAEEEARAAAELAAGNATAAREALDDDGDLEDDGDDGNPPGNGARAGRER